MLPIYQCENEAKPGIALEVTAFTAEDGNVELG